MMVCLLGLLRTERLAREMSAVTRVMDILKQSQQPSRKLPGGAGGSLPRCSPALKLVLQKVKQRFLHHVRHLKRR